MKNIQFIYVNNLLNNSKFRVVLCSIWPAKSHLHGYEPGVGEKGAGNGESQTDCRQPVGPVRPELFVDFRDKDRPTDPR